MSGPCPSPTRHLPDAVEQRRLCGEQYGVHAHDEGQGVLEQYAGERRLSLSSPGWERRADGQPGRQGSRAGRTAWARQVWARRPTGDARSGKTWPKKEGARLASAPQTPAKAECSLNTVGSSRPMKGLSAML